MFEGCCSHCTCTNRMDFGISGKRALVSGTGKGIGYGVARSLAREGAKVAVVSRGVPRLNELIEEMGGAEKGHYAISADLVADGAPSKIINQLDAEFGKIDILVNNLGSTLDITDPYCSIDDWRAVYRMNMEVMIEFNNLVIPYMRARGWGRIITVSSTAGMENNGPVPYCSVKAAVIAYSHSMGRVLAKEGVVMSCVLPGAIFTEDGFWDKALVDRPEHVEKYLQDRCPSGRFGEIDDIGTMVAFLSSSMAKFTQGAVIPVDGGQSRHYFVKP